jgi:hypothetical protein
VGLYADFLQLAWQEGGDSLSALDLAHDLSISPCHAAVLVSQCSDWDDDLLDCGDSTVFAKALRRLAYQSREEVVEALIRGFGDSSLLFASLWRTRPEYSRVSITEVLNDATWDKMPAFEWIQAGCP